MLQSSVEERRSAWPTGKQIPSSLSRVQGVRPEIVRRWAEQDWLFLVFCVQRKRPFHGAVPRSRSTRIAQRALNVPHLALHRRAAAAPPTQRRPPVRDVLIGQLNHGGVGRAVPLQLVHHLVEQLALLGVEAVDDLDPGPSVGRDGAVRSDGLGNRARATTAAPGAASRAAAPTRLRRVMV
jgi:hypothetical protein